jgi:curved DNA-binding protein
MARDLYSVLGVSKTASADEIKKTYRKLAGKLHPDKNPGDSKTEDKFKEVNRAYQVLSDTNKRALYDEFGEDGLREGFDATQYRAYQKYRQQGGGSRSRVSGMPGDYFVDGNMGDLGDIFSDMFGHRAGRAQASRRGRDIESSLTIDFATAIKGATIEVHANGAPADTISVRIPAGADDGNRLRIAGQGSPGRAGGPAGDLLLVLKVNPHPHFRREKNDLHIDIPVGASEAFFGAKIRVPTPEGAVNMKLPPHSQSGQTIRLKGKGVKRQGQMGDLYVHLLIKLPKDEEAAKFIKELESFETEDLREGIEF